MKKGGLLILLLLAVWWVTAQGGQQVDTTLGGTTMGTSYQVRISPGLSATEEQRWHERIQASLDNVNALMSTYQADSEISCFNRSDSTDWYPVSSDTAQVVSVAMQVARQTRGAFDITVSPLVNLWNFGPDRRPAAVPTDGEIDAALEHVGYKQLQVRTDPPALRKDIPELTIDLSGIAKGFAVDQVGRLLENGGITSYMVEVGGEIRTRGRKHDGTSWRIGLERPEVGQRIVETVLQLQDNCLATSGDYRNVFEWEGQLYSHEIDPRTGRPVQNGLAAVSVLASSAMWADAYATGLMIMRPDEAWQLASEGELEIMTTVRGPQGLTQRMTDGFAAAIEVLP
jgi:thiamine biosynthesis lipoprotein